MPQLPRLGTRFGTLEAPAQTKTGLRQVSETQSQSRTRSRARCRSQTATTCPTLVPLSASFLISCWRFRCKMQMQPQLRVFWQYLRALTIKRKMKSPSLCSSPPTLPCSLALGHWNFMVNQKIAVFFLLFVYYLFLRSSSFDCCCGAPIACRRPCGTTAPIVAASFDTHTHTYTVRQADREREARRQDVDCICLLHSPNNNLQRAFNEQVLQLAYRQVSGGLICPGHTRTGGVGDKGWKGWELV